MKLTITGRPKKKFNRLLYEEASQWYADRIFSKNLNKKIKVDLEFATLPKELYADCRYRNPKDCKYRYSVRLNRKMGQKMALIALAHEMIHVKHYATRELTAIELEPSGDYIEVGKWHGKIYDSKKIDYWDLPWEIEAHGREFGLYIRFINDAVERGLA